MGVYHGGHRARATVTCLGANYYQKICFRPVEGAPCNWGEIDFEDSVFTGLIREEYPMVFAPTTVAAYVPAPTRPGANEANNLKPPSGPSPQTPSGENDWHEELSQEWDNDWGNRDEWEPNTWWARQNHWAPGDLPNEPTMPTDKDTKVTPPMSRIVMMSRFRPPSQSRSNHHNRWWARNQRPMSRKK